MCIPIEVPAVYHAAPHLRGMSVHILGGGVGHDVGPPFKRSAVDGCGESVVDHQWHAVTVGDACKLLDVENLASRVRDGFTEEQFGVGLESLFYFLFRSILIHKGAADAQLLQRNAEEVVGAAIDFIGSNDVVAGLTNIEHGIEVGSLSARREHGPHPTFERSNLSGHGIVGGILQTRIEIALLFQIEKVGHLFCIIILERGALHNGQHARLSVLGLPPCLHAQCGRFQIFFHVRLNVLKRMQRYNIFPNLKAARLFFLQCEPHKQKADGHGNGIYRQGCKAWWNAKPAEKVEKCEVDKIVHSVASGEAHEVNPCGPHPEGKERRHEEVAHKTDKIADGIGDILIHHWQQHIEQPIVNDHSRCAHDAETHNLFECGSKVTVPDNHPAGGLFLSC